MKLGNVLSLFDGCSGGQMALNKAGFTYNKYYASEIEKNPIAVTQFNYPDTVQLGDVTKVFSKDLPKIDLLLGGSPCQGFSFAGKQLNFDDERSKLFFEYVRLLDECKPKYFLLENVKMKKEYQDIISEHLGVQPIEINSSLMSAQNRKRLYWTNIPNIVQPTDKGILLKDILITGVVDEKKSATIKEQYYKSSKANFERSGSFHATGVMDTDELNNLLANPNSRVIPEDQPTDVIDAYNRRCVNPDKSTTLRTNNNTGNIWVTLNKNQLKKLNEINTQNDKMGCLTEATVARGGSSYEYLSMLKRVDGADGEYEPKLVTDKDSLCKQVGMADLNGHDFLKRVYSPDGKAPTLTAVSGGNQERKVAVDKKMWRKLHPIECERLQTVPDGYTEFGIMDGELKRISNTQRYKMLGNGWSIDVIAHMLQNMFTTQKPTGLEEFIEF